MEIVAVTVKHPFAFHCKGQTSEYHRPLPTVFRRQIVGCEGPLRSEWPSSKNLETINAGEGVEKREPSCTLGGNVN